MTTSIGFTWLPLFEFLQFSDSSFPVVPQGEELTGRLGGACPRRLVRDGIGELRASDARVHGA